MTEVGRHDSSVTPHSVGSDIKTYWTGSDSTLSSESYDGDACNELYDKSERRFDPQYIQQQLQADPDFFTKQMDTDPDYFHKLKRVVLLPKKAKPAKELTPLERLAAHAGGATYFLNEYEREDPLFKHKEEDFLGSLRDDIVYSEFIDHTKLQWDAQWTAGELTPKPDEAEQFKKMPASLQYVTKILLSMVTVSDPLINKGIVLNQLHAIQPEPVLNCLLVQPNAEVVHTTAYKILNKIFFESVDEQQEMLNAYENSDALGDLVGWCIKWVYDANSISRIFVATALFEGAAFFHTFVEVAILGKNFKLQLLRKFNEWIMRDENLHWNTGTMIVRHMQPATRPPQEEVHEIAESLLQTIVKFQYWMLNNALDIQCQADSEELGVQQDRSMYTTVQGIDVDQIIDYTKWLIDLILVSMKYEKLYNTKIDILELQDINMCGKAEIMARESTEYQKISGGEKLMYDDLTEEEEF
jgi:ribonucleotide reductase beta subunit family protein with ferritin-like domain